MHPCPANEDSLNKESSEVTHPPADPHEKASKATSSRNTERPNSPLLPDLSKLEQEKNKYRGEWRLHTQPHMEQICNAILRDNCEQIEMFFSTNSLYKIRSLTYPIKVETRSGNMITSKAMTLGHLLTMFTSPMTLESLDGNKLLTPSLFRLRCDIEVEYLSTDIVLGQGTSEELQERYRSIPCSFMAGMRDNLPTLKWLLMKGYLRRHVNEVDSTGRNLIHCCVDDESPAILQELLNNRKILSWSALEEMLRTRESKHDDTPFTRAVKKTDPAMLVFFIHTCPKPFVNENMDLSGIRRSVLNLLLTHIVDSSLCMAIIKEFLKRGALPDRHPSDDTSVIETLIANVNFSGPELKHGVKLLLKYFARPTSGALLKLLRLRFRTDQELLSLFKLLLKAGGTRALLGESAFRAWSAEKERGKLKSLFGRGDGNSVVIEIVKNKRISVSKMERLFSIINQYADISVMFPDADGIALAISERMAYDPSRDEHTDLEQILRLLLRFACTHKEEENVRGFLDRLLRGLLRFLFEKNDFRKADKTHEKVLAYISHVIQTMEKLEMDFNALVDGQVGLFSLFHPNVPDEVVFKSLEILPKSFDYNLMNSQSENLATLSIKRFHQDFYMVYRIFMHLREIGFDFTKEVYMGETLLMVYVRKCGETFDQMETNDTMTAYVEEDFFKVMRFLLDEHLDIMHQATSKNKESGRSVNVLGVSMQLSHCTIAEEILKLNPKVLASVHIETVLSFIRVCPEVLELLNGCSLLLNCDSYSTLERSEDFVKPYAMSHLGTNIDAAKCLSTIRSLWLNYIQYHHVDMLTLVGERDGDQDFSKQVELIYDYLIRSNFDDVEEDAAPSRVAMEFSVFRRAELEHIPCTRKKVDQERVNSSLFMKIVEECDNMKHHPLFTEYFENFYRTALLNSLAFILYHMIFVIFLNGSMTNVVTPLTHYAVTSLKDLPMHYICPVDTCTYAKLNARQRSYIVLDASKPCYMSSKPNCQLCFAHTANRSLCAQPASANRTECPFTMHFGNAWIIPVLYLLLAMSIIGLIRESIQFMLDPRDYMRSYIQNPLEVSMYIFAILFAINITDCPVRAGLKTTWQFQLGCVAVLYSWYMLFFYMSKFPAFATHVIMFYQAVKSGLTLLITFSSLLLGFSFEFHLILGNQRMFRTIWTSINKVWLMTEGEIDFKDIMTDRFESPEDESTQVHFEVLTRIMLILFILLISIVLMNLFIGLIVGDVDTINKLAEAKKWKWNLEFIEYTDTMRDIFNKWVGPLKKCCFCRRKREQLQDTFSHEPRVTKYIVEQEAGKFYITKSEKAGPYVTELSWKNIFKWSPVANFFGFVTRKELLKRLMTIENRKRKLAIKYISRRRLERVDAADGEIIKKVNLPTFAAMSMDEADDTDPESEVTIHDDAAAHLKISQPIAYMGKEQLDVSFSDGAEVALFLPRHERRAIRRLMRPTSADSLNKIQVGVGVQLPRSFFPSLNRNRSFGRLDPYSKALSSRRI